jgi:hypothetical protein
LACAGSFTLSFTGGADLGHIDRPGSAVRLVAPGLAENLDTVAVLCERSTSATTQAAPGKTVPHCL